MSRVEIYSKGYCPYCQRAKALLDRRGVDYKEIEVTADLEGLQEMIRRSGGKRTVPQIFIDGQGIGGCDDLFALERSGKLDELLSDV